MEYWPIIASLVAIALSIYYFLLKQLWSLKNTGIPYQRPIPIFGNMAPLVFRHMSIAELITSIYEFASEAKYVGFFDMMTPVIVIRDIDLIKTIGVKNFDNFTDHRSFADEILDPLVGKNLANLRGEKWRDMRALLGPAFTASKMRMMFKLMTVCAQSFVEFALNDPTSTGGNEFEMRNICTRYTNDVIATCAFGISVDSLKEPMNESYLRSKEVTKFDGVTLAKVLIGRSLPRIARLLDLKIISNRARKFFESIISTSIKTRKDMGVTRPDMIQLMMDSRDKKSGDELTIEDMTSQAFIFLLGGFDTSATALCFALYELAMNRDAQERLQSEVDDVLEMTKGKPAYEAINNMAYLDAVLKETLRMYPIGASIDRVCTKRFELPPALPGGKPFIVKKGMIIWFPVYAIHHDPKYFKEPSKFNPDRFIDNNAKEIHNNGTFLAFGLGPRMCIGTRFAYMELKILLFHLLAECDVKPCSRTLIPMRFAKYGLFLLIEGDLWLRFERRENPHSSYVVNKTYNDHVVS